MKTIHIDDANLIVSDPDTGFIFHSVNSLSYSFDIIGDDLLIIDDRNDYKISYDEAEDEEGNTFANVDDLHEYVKVLREEPIDLGQRVRVGNNILTDVGGGLIIENDLGDSTSSNYLGVIERTNVAGNSELVVKRRTIDEDIVEDSSTAYQSLTTHIGTATVDGRGRFTLNIDIYAPEDGFTKEYRSKLLTTIDNGNIKVYNISQAPLNPEDYKNIPGQTGWYIGRRAYWKYLNNREIEDGLGYDGTVGDYGLPLVKGIEYKAGEYYRIEISGDNEFQMQGVDGAPDLFGGTQFIPYIERTYTGVQYSVLRTGVDVEGAVDLTGQTMDFILDDTSTNILLSNGRSFNVNSIKAEANADGTVHISSEQGAIEYYVKLDHTSVTIDGVAVSGGLQDVVNTLNELFTVGPFQAIVIADPYSTMVADVAGTATTTSYVGYGMDPIGTDVYGSTSSNSQNGYKTTDTIDQAGEYFTFDIRVEGTIGFGLIHSQASYDAGHWSGSSAYADPTRFGIDNSAHYGFQFSHWFHPTPNGSWTNYGSNTYYSMRPGWSNFNGTDEQADWIAGNPIKVRVGIDTNGYISIETLRDGTDWVAHSRTSYPVPEGAEFHLGIKTNHTGARVYTAPKVHLLEPAAPTMYFRYIESPDDNYHYPLFATEEEANYYDLQNGGTGTSSSNVYPDEPTFSTWYEPTNGHTYDGTSAPTSATTFLGNAVAWTEITSIDNAALVPEGYPANTITLNELSSVNVQLHPAGAGFTTTVVDTDGSGLALASDGIHLNGTAPDVTGDYTANPSDTYTFEVVRTNSYGSSSGTLTLVVTNLTAPVVAISGFNHHTDSAAMIDSDTMGDGSAVHVNNTVADGERFVIEKAYVETNILPNLTATNDKYIIGLSNTGADFTTLELSDFDTAIVWEYESSSSHTFKFYRDGSVVQNIVVNSLTQAFYDYAIEVEGTSAWLIACNINSIMNEASPADGGVFSHTYEATSIEDTAPVQIHMAALNTSGDISTNDIETITTPTPAPTNLTSWNKALDFSGGSEHLKQVTQSTGSNAIRMSGLALLATANADTSKTSSHTYSRPWATAIVFQTPNNTANQHIWNSGEGAGTGDDNIYLRMSGSNGELYFGWGREGVGYNEYHIGNFGGSYNQSTGQWWGIYISHDGTRLSAADATAANLNNAFEFRLMGTNDATPVFDTLYDVGGDVNNWTSTGVRMDRDVKGDFTIGGRGTNRSFHGKVASMVVTTLVRGATKPTDAEIKLMLTDPMKWEDDYKDGQSARYSYNGSSFTYGPSNSNSKYATQIWLMGDGTSDSYSNGIRNQVDPTDQNNTKLQLNSMVSNDIENVNITGLS